MASLINKVKEGYHKEKEKAHAEAAERRQAESQQVGVAGHSDQPDPDHIDRQEESVSGHADEPDDRPQPGPAPPFQPAPESGGEAQPNIDGGLFGDATQGSGGGFGGTGPKGPDRSGGGGFGSGNADTERHQTGDKDPAFAPNETADAGGGFGNDTAGMGVDSSTGGGFGRTN